MRGHPLLEVLAKAGMKMGLSRVHSYLEWLGDPHRRYPVIHVAGTNGKGSVCRMLGAILQAQGFKVGVTTSPHLEEVNERIRVDDVPIADEALDALLRRMDVVRRAWAAAVVGPEAYPLTYFEFSTAAAFQHFADVGVDVAVVEVGMGGRLDATNVVDPALTAIVSIGLDHTEQLGHDHASIAGEKAGILKPNVPVVVGPLSPEAMATVRAVAAERRAPLRAFGQAFSVSGAPEAFSFRGEAVAGGDIRANEMSADIKESRKIAPLALDGLESGLLGDHQLVNAAVAIELIRLLPPELACGEAAIRVGLRAARNEGRLEWARPGVLLDGAHNPDGALTLAAWLSRQPPGRRTLLLGGGVDKDIWSVACTLARRVDRIVATQGSHPKARTVESVCRDLAGLPIPVEPGGPLPDALDRLLAEQEREPGLLIVAGSLYLVGEARSLLNRGR